MREENGPLNASEMDGEPGTSMVAKPSASASPAIDDFRSRQNLLRAVAAGAAAGALCAATSGLIARLTGWMGVGAWMILATGVAVGLAMRFFGRGVDWVFGVFGALLTLAFSVVGYFIAVCGIVARHEEVSFFAAPSHPGFGVAWLAIAVLQPAKPLFQDQVFLILAAYLGYRLSLVRFTLQGRPESLARRILIGSSRFGLAFFATWFGAAWFFVRFHEGGLLGNQGGSAGYGLFVLLALLAGSVLTFGLSRIVGGLLTGERFWRAVLGAFVGLLLTTLIFTSFLGYERIFHSFSGQVRGKFLLFSHRPAVYEPPPISRKSKHDIEAPPLVMSNRAVFQKTLNNVKFLGLNLSRKEVFPHLTAGEDGSLPYESVKRWLHPSEDDYYMAEVPRIDGWGHEIEFWINSTRFLDYSIVVRSPGKNGVFEPGSYSEGTVVNELTDTDIVWARARDKDFCMPRYSQCRSSGILDFEGESGDQGGSSTGEPEP